MAKMKGETLNFDSTFFVAFGGGIRVKEVLYPSSRAKKLSLLYEAAFYWLQRLLSVHRLKNHL